MGTSKSVRTQFLEDGAETSYDRARVVLLPVPYEGTVSYVGGAARGPQAILDASEQLELYDERIAAEPWRCGIHTMRALDVASRGPEEVAAAVERATGRLLDDAKWPVILGGEHSITPGAVRAAAARHPGLHVVQLDAHADLRESYQGSPHSHACAMARCVDVATVHAFGIRAYSRDEADRIRRGIPGYRVTHAWEMRGVDWIDMALDELRDRAVYLTVDVDYFDPSVVPATGTPEPGGGLWEPTLELLERLFRTAHVVGCDVVELAPVPGLHHADFTVARLVYKLIGFACGGVSPDAASR